MNIALPAVVIFLLLFPGFLARARFKLVKNESLDYSPLGETLAEAFLWALVLHTCWVSISVFFFQRYPLPDIFLHLLTSDSATQSVSISAVARDWPLVASYFSSLLLACLIIPPQVQWMIRKFRLDSHPLLGRFFRFSDAGWYYLLQGRDGMRIPDVVYVSAILSVNGKATLYDGILSNHVIGRDGELDYLVMFNVRRWDLEDFDRATNDRELQAAASPIDGDFFIIRYKETMTLKIRYIFLNDLAPEEETLPEMTETVH